MMDELISIMSEIRDQLVELNRKIDSLTSYGMNDISDVCSRLDQIDSSLGTIDSSLGTIDLSLSSIDTSISLID